MIELSSSMKKRLVKMLMDSSVTSNFISNATATMLKLEAQEDKDFHKLTLADRTVMRIAWYVWFVMNCGDYKGKVVARYFPTYIRSVS